MLQDKYLPDFDFSAMHTIQIRQTPEKVFQLVYDLDLRESWLIRLLFGLRGLTTEMQMKKGMVKENFIELEQRINSEIILGLVGQFWKPKGNLQKLNTDAFVHFTEDNFLKATWSFKAIPQHDSTTLLETETRIKCYGKKAYRKFSLYWFFIRPFSGVIRKEILKLIKTKAEQMPLLPSD